MSQHTTWNRRKLIQGTLGAAAAAAVPGWTRGEKKKKLPWEFCTFTKPLQHLSYAECARVVSDLGFDGVEAPVRPGGHVVPERVEEDLPKLVEALKGNGLALTLLTSGINEVSEKQRTETVLKTAAGLGVKRFRMAYYKYDLKKPIFPQLKEFEAKLKDLVALTDELGVKPVYQNHSGKNYFGGPIWDLYEVFSNFNPSQIGAAFDIGHATVEGSKVWPLNFALIRDYMDTVYIKEPYWSNNKQTWGPIGNGSIDKGFYKTLKSSEFAGPISVHVEYLGHKDPKIVPAVIKAMGENFATVKELLG